MALKDKPASIELSGKAYVWENNDDERDAFTVRSDELAGYEQRGSESFDIMGDCCVSKLKYSPGDIKLMPKLDSYGKLSRRYGHTNYGYSGYFKAYICRELIKDASPLFSNLCLWQVVPESDRHYTAQQEKGTVLARLKGKIENLAGISVHWENKKYQFPVALRITQD